MKNKESVAVKLPFEPGEFHSTWDLPHHGAPTATPGLLSLEVGKYPYVKLYGDLPIKWIDSSASFPQRHEFSTLVGELSNGGSIALMNGELSYWFENQGSAIATFAVLSRDKLSTHTPRKYQAIELSIDGLDAVMGWSPISKVKVPDSTSKTRDWSATVNRDAHADWEIADNKMSVWYNASIRAFDFYEFGMVFGSVLRITSTHTLTVEQWWTDWVQPLRQLISLFTQRPRDIHGFLATQDANNPRTARDQVFGWDITQSTQNANRDKIRDINTLVNIASDKVNLLALTNNWRDLSNAHHPLVETYGAMTTIAEQHPRSRILLYLQALEGLYGFENKDKQIIHEAAYQKKREEVLERTKEQQVTTADMRFLKKNLAKRPPGGLHDALVSILKSLPIDVRPELESTTLFTTLRSSHEELLNERTEKILVKIRNDLSHGTVSYTPADLYEIAIILERVIRAESLRIIDAPKPSQKRALESHLKR